MEILRDEEYVDKQKRRGRQASLIGFIFLLGGFVLVFVNVQYLVLFQLVALLIGFGLSQYGLYLTQRFGRSPRPDEVLDDALKSVTRDGRLYHYILPAPHVLLTKAGPIVFVLKYQTGNIVADGDDWRQTGIGFRRFFGQEGLGDPTKEADKAVSAMAGYINQHAPELDEVLIAPMIVFTSKNIKNLDVDDSNIPAMHFSKVKGFLRQKGLGDPMPKSDFDTLRTAFDQAAGDLV
ncbi:MAG: hypothetical protein PVH03_01685 [Chloroflexota bacterium]|jgi:hypothetical protein